MPPVHRPSLLTVAFSVAACTLPLLISSAAPAPTASAPKPIHHAQSQPVAPDNDSNLPGGALTPPEAAQDDQPANDKTTPDASVPSAPFLLQRINLSDTHRVWHPSRRQLGMTKRHTATA